jgi:Flp pilus assembly pilin Flp
MSAKSSIFKSKKGASLVEYGMTVGLVAVFSIGAVSATGTKVEDIFCLSTNAMKTVLGQEGLDCAAVSGGSSDTSVADLDNPNADRDWDGGSIGPDDFSFETLYGADPATEVFSNTVEISGLSEAIPVKAFFQSMVSINGGPFVFEGEVVNGDTVQLKGASADDFGASRGFSLRAGTVHTTWSVKNKVGDISPDDLVFADVIGVAPYYNVHSESFRLSGIEAPVQAQVESGLYLYRFNSTYQAWWIVGNGGEVSEGDLLRLSMKASAQLSTSITKEVTIGTGVASWTVTTQDTLDTPNLDFVSLLSIEQNDLVPSNEVVMAGLTTPARLTFSGFSNYVPKYSINGEMFNCCNVTGGSVFVDNGDRIKLFGQFTQSASFGRSGGTTINIAGSSRRWDVRYADGIKSVSMSPLTPVFGDPRTDAQLSRTVSGFDGIARIRSGNSGMRMSVNGTQPVSDIAVRANDIVAFEADFSNNVSTTSTYDYSVGDADYVWEIRTNPLDEPTWDDFEPLYLTGGAGTVYVPYDVSGSNANYFLTVSSEWGGIVRVIKGGASSVPPATIYTGGAAGNLHIWSPPAGTTGEVTVTLHDKYYIADSDMVVVKTFDVQSPPS